MEDSIALNKLQQHRGDNLMIVPRWMVLIPEQVRIRVRTRRLWHGKRSLAGVRRIGKAILRGVVDDLLCLPTPVEQLDRHIARIVLVPQQLLQSSVVTVSKLTRNLRLACGENVRYSFQIKRLRHDKAPGP